MILSSDFLASIDFTNFSVSQFAQAVTRLRGRTIRFFDRPMPLTLHGLWLSDQSLPKEYVFVNNRCPDLLQKHTRIYELAHILLGHRTFAITAESLEVLTRSRSIELPMLKQIGGCGAGEVLRFEREAELIAIELGTRCIAGDLDISSPEKQQIVSNLTVLNQHLKRMLAGGAKIRQKSFEDLDKIIYALVIEILDQKLAIEQVYASTGYEGLEAQWLATFKDDSNYQSMVIHYSRVGEQLV